MVSKGRVPKLPPVGSEVDCTCRGKGAPVTFELEDVCSDKEVKYFNHKYTTKGGKPINAVTVRFHSDMISQKIERYLEVTIC